METGQAPSMSSIRPGASPTVRRLGSRSIRSWFPMTWAKSDKECGRPRPP